MMKDIRRLFKQQISDYPEDAYNITSNLNWYRYVRQVRYLAKRLPTNSVILDAGTGWGHIPIMLRSLRKDLEIFALDIKPYNCWKKLKKYNIKFLTDNAESTNFRSNTFDAVISFGLLEHLDEGKFLNEVYRILKDRGLFFIFNLPNRYSLNEFMAKKLGIWYHTNKFSKKEIYNMLTIFGFEVIDFKIEFLIPAQVNRISKKLNNIFNSNYLLIQKIDDILTKTPLKLIAEAISIYCKVNK